MKLIRLLAKVAAIIVVAIVLLVLALPLWVGPVVRPVANSVVPKKTGTGFLLGEFGLNPYVGKVRLGDMHLENPEGFSPKMAVEVNGLSVEVDPLTVMSDVVVINDITIDGVFVSYVMGLDGVSNFEVIKRNAGGSKADDKTGKDVEEKKIAAKEKSRDDGAKKKVIIDHLLVKNVKVQVGPLAVPVPPLELKGIGRNTMGATVQEAWEQISVESMKLLNSAGLNVSMFMKGIGGLGAKHAEQAAQLLKRSGVNDEKAKRILDTINKLGGSGADASGKAVDGASDAVKDAGKAILNMFGK